MNDNELTNLADALAQRLVTSATNSPLGGGAAAAPPGVVMPPVEIYYESGTSWYWMKTKLNRYIRIGRSDVEKHLTKAGFDPRVGRGQLLSDVDLAVTDIQEEHDVDFAGSLAGFSQGLVTSGSFRLLITSQAEFIAPFAGNWDLLRGILEGMFGTIQLQHLFGWIKISLLMYRSGIWMAGQTIFVCGPPAAGKNLLAHLLNRIFGGRPPGKPHRYMMGATAFNSDFAAAEFLTIEDEVAATGFQARRDFGARIKEMAVNKFQSIHAKGKPAVTVSPLWRLLVSLNDQPERLLIIPPIDSDIEDKLMLFLVERRDMPMTTETPEQYGAFMAALEAELPAFVHFVENWPIPNEIRSSRFGVAHYHHPTLLKSLKELSPEQRLLDLIDDFIFTVSFPGPWTGLARELERQLKDSEKTRCAKEAEKLLMASNSCGNYLGRLRDKMPERVSVREVNGNKVWRIEAPEDHETPYAPKWTGNAAKSPKVSMALMEKVIGKPLSEMGKAEGPPK